LFQRKEKLKKSWDKPFAEKIARRVKRIPTRDLDMWVDQAMLDLGRQLSAYSKTNEAAYIEAALLGAESIHAVVNELYARTQKPVDL
jgi:hypothetical protein